jgi:hypothetical protein
LALPTHKEMYGLIFAAVQLELPFTLVRSFVVSETASKVREGWAYVDRLSDQQVCQPLSQISAPLPVTMHYCERYVVLDCGQLFGLPCTYDI